jgi:hypothetical protein
VWKALYELGQIRNQAIKLRGLRAGLETKRFRHVDQLPPEFLSYMEPTLPCSLEPTEIIKALREATARFFDEARSWGEMLDRDLVTRFEHKLTDYLALIGESDREVEKNGR